ncbi:MAG: hypothetical protein Ct9H300mP28_24850 [Pseudomonadota bacterium]|nr:MAG: hypothetical protein Ct9H300mP28_24850 [Pseudomonadota bacterium]
MSNKEKEKVDQQSELNLTRRSVLGAGAAIAGAGIIGSQLIIQLLKQLMLRVATNHQDWVSGSPYRYWSSLRQVV